MCVCSCELGNNGTKVDNNLPRGVEVFEDEIGDHGGENDGERGGKAF